MSSDAINPLKSTTPQVPKKHTNRANIECLFERMFFQDMSLF